MNELRQEAFFALEKISRDPELFPFLEWLTKRFGYDTLSTMPTSANTPSCPLTFARNEGQRSVIAEVRRLLATNPENLE